MPRMPNKARADKKTAAADKDQQVVNGERIFKPIFSRPLPKSFFVKEVEVSESSEGPSTSRRPNPAQQR